MEDREKAIRQRLKEDFPHYAEKCLKIRPKDIREGLIPLRLNPAQRIIHQAVEDQRARMGMVRAIILKARQQGSSTYVEGRFMWKVSHSHGARGFIIAHTDDSTLNLFNMSKCYYENLPDAVKPIRSKSNAKEMVFPRLTSSYRTETAGGRGAGRSETIQFLHLSEVSYFPNAEETTLGVTNAVPRLPGTEIFLESTSTGPSGVFYEMAMDAIAGKSEYILIFVPWFVQEEYYIEPPEDFAMDTEEEEYAEQFNLTPGQIYWRRMKVAEGRSIAKFRREYPSTVEEAFRVSAPGALWTQDMIAATRVAAAPPLARIVVAIDPSGSDRLTADAQGIIVAGRSYNDHAYVLEDGTCKLAPEGWAARALALYDKYEADCIVVETNYGGQMVASTIRSLRPWVHIKEVTATRGKAIRAEPVSALYEKGVIHHVGMFAALEDELVTWSQLTSKKSPNRLDALVWAMTELVASRSSSIISREMEI